MIGDPLCDEQHASALPQRSGWALRQFEQLPDLSSHPATIRVVLAAVFGLCLAYLSSLCARPFEGIGDEVVVVGCFAIAWILGAAPGVIAAVICSIAGAIIAAAHNTDVLLTPGVQTLVAGTDMVVLVLTSSLSSTARALIRQALRRKAILRRDAAVRAELAEQLQRSRDGLAVTNAQLEHSLHVRDRFLAHMSHEVRSPLNGVLGLLRVLSKTKLSLRQQEFADGATRSAERLLRLVNELLDSGLASPTMIDAEASEFDLSLLVNETLCTFYTLATGKGLTLSATYADQVPRFVVGPRRAVEQVLNNLVMNALKFTDHGDVWIQVEGEMRVGGEVDLCIIVGDSGRGIPSSEIEHLFDRSGRNDPADRAQRNGAGLGLGIAYQLVSAMGGTLSVTSTVGVGSQFECRIRLAIDKRPRSFASVESGSLMQGVLIAGAYCGDAIAIEEMLRRKKVWTDHRSNLDEAAILLRQTPKDRKYNMVILVGGGASSSEALIESLGLMRVPVITFGMNADELSKVAASGCSVVQGVAGDNLLSLIEEAFLHLSLLTPHETVPDPDDGSSLNNTGVFPVVHGASSRCALIVDDDPVGQLVMRELLLSLGVGSEAAHSGEQALSRLARDEFALVFMDKRMPVMDGIETTRRIRLQERRLGQPRVPIVACSANDSPGDRAEFRAAGMDDVVPKPVDITRLERTLERLHIRRNIVAAVADPTPTHDRSPTERHELSSIFLDAGNARIGELNAAIRARDFELASLAAHTLKSMSRHMGFKALAEVCEAIERSAQASPPTVNEELIVRAVLLYASAEADLQSAV